MSGRILLIFFLLLAGCSNNPFVGYRKIASEGSLNCLKSAGLFNTSQSVRSNILKEPKNRRILQSSNIFDLIKNLYKREFELEDVKAYFAVRSPFFKGLNISDDLRAVYEKQLAELILKHLHKKSQKKALMDFFIEVMEKHYKEIKKPLIISPRKFLLKRQILLANFSQKSFGKFMTVLDKKGKQLGKVYFYPLVAPFSLTKTFYKDLKTYGVMGALKAPFHFIADDGWYVAGWVGAVATQVGIIYSFDYTFQSADFVQETILDPENDRDKNLVWIDGNGDDAGWSKVDRMDFDKLNDFTKKEFIKVEDLSDFEEKISNHAEKNGKISTLILGGHGFPGKIQVGEDILSLENLDSIKLENIFNPNAKIIMNSCLTGNDSIDLGSEFMKRLGNSWLQEGGEVIAAKKVLFNWPSKEVFQAIEEAENKTPFIEKALNSYLEYGFANAIISFLSLEQALSGNKENIRRVKIKPQK